MRIAVGVSGGIAAYKSCELVRRLGRAGADVQVVLTRNGSRFVTALTLRALSGRPVLCDVFEAEGEGPVHHIDASRDLDALVVAPATADILAKFAHGIADEVLSTFYLATTAPVVVAPAMNTRMWQHPATQDNLATLARRGVIVVPPEHGWLAEREVGWGRMAEPEVITAAVLQAAERRRELAGRRIVITAGPTREAIDPVRFVSSRSSGRMGYALAEAAARRGASVCLVSGPSPLPPPYGVELVRVETAAQMREAVMRERAAAHAVVMAAAVSDWAPATAAASKIKKSGGPLTLDMEPGPDILAELGKSKGDLLLVGFAAETESLVEGARTKLEQKNLDFVVANDVSNPASGMESADNEVIILDRRGGRVDVPRASKETIAEAILDRIFSEWRR